jgi:hypothetical protein
VVCCGAWTGCISNRLDVEYEEDGEGGRAKKEIEPPVGLLEFGYKWPGILEGVNGVGGASAIWAIPPVRSTLNKVVGLVLAAIL